MHLPGVIDALESLVGSSSKPGEERAILVDRLHHVMVDTTRSTTLKLLSRLVHHEVGAPPDLDTIFAMVQGHGDSRHVTVSVDHVRNTMNLLYDLGIDSCTIHVRDDHPLVIGGDQVRVAIAPMREPVKVEEEED